MKAFFYIFLALSLTACLHEDQKPYVEEVLGEDIQFSAFNVNAFPLNKVVCDPFDTTAGGGAHAPLNGLRGKLFYRTSSMPRYYSAQSYVDLTQASGKDLFLKDLNVPTRMFNTGFASQTTEVLKNDLGETMIEFFGLKLNTVIRLGPNDPEGTYEFALLSDDGSKMKIREPDESWSVYIDNDGDHQTRMGCATRTIEMTRSTRLEVEVLYYQGPRYHIANVLMWRPTTEAGKDTSCGKAGNSLYFNPDSGSTPTATYQGLLARNWKVVANQNFFIPGSDIDFSVNYNPCDQGEVPVITDFRVSEVAMTDAWIRWQTSIPATAQLKITEVGSTISTLTPTDNILRTTHEVHIGGLKNRTTYKIQALSISDTLGKALSEEIQFTTP